MPSTTTGGAITGLILLVFAQGAAVSFSAAQLGLYDLTAMGLA